MITRYGGPEVFEVQTAPDPHASRGEVRIRVHGAGVNFADLSARAGLYPEAPKAPMVVGYEVAGVVDEVGEGVDHLAVGDEVFSVTRFGGYSDVVVVPAYQAQRIPAGKDLIAAAGVPVPYLTAYVMLNRLGSVRPGDTVLIHAAAGGVGLAALQLARGLGAKTIGTASGRKHERLRELGLDHPIDYHTQDFEKEVMRITNGRGVDVALDAVGGTSARKSFKCLAPMGRLFMFGVSSANANSRREAWKTMPKMLATAPIFHALQLMNSNKGVFGVNMAGLWDLRELIAENLVELSSLWDAGDIDPFVDTTFPFSRAGEAHERLQQAKNFGKVVLVPDARFDAANPG
jgi:NADPH:quinone reductase-like Zn-dependent oxidoreductase